MLDIVIKVAENIEKGVKPLIGWEKSDEIVKIGADGTPTKKIDLIAENIAIKSIEKYCSALLVSEEIGFKKIGKGIPEYVIVLDPIDGTFNALNDIPIYSVSIAMGHLKKSACNNIKNDYDENDKNDDFYENLLSGMTINDLEVGVVNNIATGDIYCAKVNEGAYIIESPNREKRKINVSNIKNLKDASVGVFAYGLTTNTLDFIKDRMVKRIRIFGSAALEMCYVARGALDAFINVNKTTRLCDIAGGYVILRESGGIITDKDGKIIDMGLNVYEKTSLICSNNALHKKFVGIFGNKWMLKPTKFGIISRIDRRDALNLVLDVIKYLDSKHIKYALEPSLCEIINNFNNNCDNKDINSNNNNQNNMSKDIGNNNIDNDNMDNKNNITSNNNKPIEYEPMTDLNDISHIISIGGDGTVLRASRVINGNEIPIIPINMGTVGFLTEFNKNKVFEAIDKIVNGNYEIEKRTKCAGLIKHADYSLSSGCEDKDNKNNFNNSHNYNNFQKILPDALNEVVIITKSPAKMLHFEVYVNGNFVEDVRADGLIVSTPTGSTAYSLSAGGPILEPSVDAFVIVPICPFKLFSRPIVIDGNSEIKIKVLKKSTLVVVDGNIEDEAKKGDEIILRKSNSYSYFVKGCNFYNKLRKLSIIGKRDEC
ncbi:inorganic polyphosphate/ATP-NAD kinase [Methanothermococcus okinawensis IH1]|uniref:NAD kinase n=2 Tax=Methanothermococcus okinawensis TaxID=155863 RepID=F8AN76_METOI|nr:inorganic polyphosphate/ATP-NAD kinase [Methanothermococcus okinawensis IH1]